MRISPGNDQKVRIIANIVTSPFLVLYSLHFTGLRLPDNCFYSLIILPPPSCPSLPALRYTPLKFNFASVKWV